MGTRGTGNAALAAVVMLGIGIIVACGHPPTAANLALHVMTSDEVLIPPAEPEIAPTNNRNDPDGCCCQVTGLARNVSAEAVHAKLKFEAFQEGEDDKIGTALEFLEDMSIGETRRLKARGFILPCNEIDRVELVEVDLRAIVFAPPE